MLPNVVIAVLHNFLEPELMRSMMAPVKTALPFLPTDPYFCMFMAFFLAYFPMGARLFMQFDWTQSPLTLIWWMTGGMLPNTTPRKSIAEIVAKSDQADKWNGSHLNQMEGFVFYAADILSCLQAGVDPAVVSDYALAYIVARIGYIFFYQISFVNTLGFIRTNFFFLCLGIDAKMFLLASAATKA